MTDITHNRLYRSTSDRVLTGVCGGLADYFGFDATVVRVLVVIASLFFMPLVPITYLVLALLLSPDPRPEKPAREERDPFERTVRSEPHAALGSVRHRYRELEARLQRLEKYVTSERYTLDREFDRLRE